MRRTAGRIWNFVAGETRSVPLGILASCVLVFTLVKMNVPQFICAPAFAFAIALSLLAAVRESA